MIVSTHPSSPASILRSAKRGSAAALALLVFSACSYQDQNLWNQCPLPESQLMPAWHKWQDARSKPEGCGSLEGGIYTCDEQRREIERVAYLCPSYVPGLMASAILAYDARQFARAQQFVDALFTLQKVHAPAAVLRGRIALEEGNIPFALRFLAEHVKLSPEDAELREVYAGALFLAEKLPEATRQLSVAANLGAPAWRVAYHRGLFEEAGGNLRQALQYYEEALRERADWDVAMARRDGIIAATYKSRKPVAGLGPLPSESNPTLLHKPRLLDSQ
jgi:tetratricopeptide (TPR) repeat protein